MLLQAEKKQTETINRMERKVKILFMFYFEATNVGGNTEFESTCAEIVNARTSTSDLLFYCHKSINT